MAKAPIYKTRGDEIMEREHEGGKSAKHERERDGGHRDGKKPAAERVEHEDSARKGGEHNDREMEHEGKHPHHEHHARHHEEREAMHHRHETERRDHHNNHREAMRQMHGRHQKEHAEMNERHMAELSDQGMGEAEGQQPVAQTAQGGGVQSPAAA